jgi:hypothetical protein
MCARRAPPDGASGTRPRILEFKTRREDGGPVVLLAAISIPKHRYLIASRFGPWSTGSICWVDTVVDSYKLGGSTRKSTPHSPPTYNNGFFASSEIFLVARGSMVFEYFSGGNRRMGIRRRGCSPQGVTRLAGLDSLATNGLGRGGIVRRPRSSVASMAFGPQWPANESPTRRLAPPEQRTAKTDPREAAQKALLVKPRWASPASQ